MKSSTPLIIFLVLSSLCFAESLQKSRMWISIGGNQEVTFAMPDGHLNITKITFTPKTVASSVFLRVTKIDPPENLPFPSQEVYQYYFINTQNLPNDNLKQASIAFVVPKEWLQEKQIAPETVVLLRYDTNHWNALKTSVVSERTAAYEFSAEASGFSYFAIAGVPPKPQVIAEAQVSLAPEPQNSSPENSTRVDPFVPPVVEEKMAKLPIIVAIGIMLLAATILFYKKRHK